MAQSFPGFSKKMPAFFRGLERDNTREWFTARKAAFEADVRGPMVELVTLVNEDLRQFAAEHALDQPARAIYRIYRDTRFSKGQDALQDAYRRDVRPARVPQARRGGVLLRRVACARRG